MEIKITKQLQEDIKDLIQITKKYFRTGDRDYLGTLHKMHVKVVDDIDYHLTDLIEDLARNSQYLGFPISKIYEAFKLLTGIDLEVQE